MTEFWELHATFQKQGKSPKLIQKPIHNLKEQSLVSKRNKTNLDASKRENDQTEHHIIEKWWSRTGSNRRPEACKATALPTELRPLIHFD